MAVLRGFHAGLILRPKAAWLAAGLTTAAMVPIAVGYSFGWTIDNPESMDVSQAENWIRVISNFTILNGATIAAVPTWFHASKALWQRVRVSTLR